MRKVCRLLIHAEQQRLKQLWRQHEADLERWFPEQPSSPSTTPEQSGASAGACTPTATPGHHAADAPARLTPVKALRCAPTPLRGADGLDSGSVEPRLAHYVMAQPPAGPAPTSLTRFRPRSTVSWTGRNDKRLASMLVAPINSTVLIQGKASRGE